MPDSFDIAVVGGGISGVSVAARLASHAHVVVLEAEEHLGAHATGRSAALLVEAYGTPGMRRLTTLSRPFFEVAAGRLFRRSSVAASSRHRLCEGGGPAASSRGIRPSAAAREGRLVGGRGSCSSFVLAEARRCRGGLRRAECARPRRQRAAARLCPQSSAGRGREILTTRRYVASRGNRKVGSLRPASTGSPAAASSMQRRVGRRDRLAMRRRASRPAADAADRSDDRRARRAFGAASTHPFVAPIDNSYYFKPDAGAIMVSLSEEAPSEPCDAYADDLDVATGARAFSRSDDGSSRATDRDLGWPANLCAGPTAGRRLRPDAPRFLLVRRAGRHRHPDLAGAFGARRKAGPRAGSRSGGDRDRRFDSAAIGSSCRRAVPDGETDALDTYPQPRSRHPSQRRCRAGCRRRCGRDIPRARP